MVGAIGLMPAAMAELRTTTDAVLHIAEKFLAEYRATSET
jgi:hypothetical protein